MRVETTRWKEIEDYRNENAADDMRKALKDKINEKIREMTGEETMDAERGPVMALHLKEMEKSAGMWRDCQRFVKVGCTKSWKMTNRLQNPAGPCVRGTSSGLEE